MAQSNSPQSCLSTTSFEQVFRYLQWKKLTAKKLSENHRVLLEKGLDAEAVHSAEARRIVVYLRKAPYFQIQLQGAEVSIQTFANTAEGSESTLFCELVDLAQRQGLPSHYAYTYADGSANFWKIAPNEVEYIPTTPEQSSTGTYSGGSPFKKAITADQFANWEKLFYEAEKTTAEHIADRVKGSGAVSQWVAQEVCSRSFILRMNSATKQAIEQLLSTFR